MTRSTIALALLALSTGLAACGDAPREGREAGPAGPRPEAAAVAPAPTGPVTVTGRVVRPGDGEGVAGAWFIVLRPGVELADWEAATGEEAAALMTAAVVADSTGHYRVPGVPRGHDYTVMIAAPGYQSAVFAGGLTVEADAPALKDMRPVQLEPALR